jgi:excisionase family DNA binding protein
MRLISVQGAAGALGVSERYVWKLARLGRMKGAQKIGRDWLIPSPPVVLPSIRPRGYYDHRGVYRNPKECEASRKAE